MYTARYQLVRAAIVTTLIGCLMGCWTTPPKDPGDATRKSYLFYPPEPEYPRLQFLCSFSGSADVEENERRTGFADFVMGVKVEKKLLIGKPYGTAIRDGKVYVCDMQGGCIALFDFKNRTFGVLGMESRGKISQPTSIKFTDSGLMYVSDIGRGQVLVFKPNGEYVTAYGKRGDFAPADIIVDGNELYVLDVKEHRVEVYDMKKWELKRTIGKLGNLLGEFNRPTGMTMDADGNLYVTESVNRRAQKFDKTGKPLLQFGSAGAAAGHFLRPKGIAVARDGTVFVVDAETHVVHMFDQKARPLMHFGGGGSDDGQMMAPVRITLDYDNIETFRKYISPEFDAKCLVLVTNQFGTNKVNVYAYGGRKGEAPPTTE